MNQNQNRSYIAIDLKSFYASVECRERGLDPLTTNLVVADLSRTEKTICLAVSPSLKAYGISGRARLFEVVQRVKEVNAKRQAAYGGAFLGESSDNGELRDNPALALSYVVAPPRMALYLEYSTRILDVYLKYIAPEDLHVYSIDEVLIDATSYLKAYRMTVRELAGAMVRDVLKTTGITAAAGIGTNLYLCKVAMDIVAKHVAADADGVRIAQLDEMSYRRILWAHRPLTDFWRVGRGYEKKLEANGIYTMGDVARCSLGGANDYHNEELLYRLFGVNAQLLIDHAWGYEPCTMADIKAYRPQENSLCSGQVLQCPYDFEQARIVVREMTEMLVLDLVDRRLVTDQLVLTVGYDSGNLQDAQLAENFCGEVTVDRYGRTTPKHAHGTINLDAPTSSAQKIVEAVLGFYDRAVDRRLAVRRIDVGANRVIAESEAAAEHYEQLSFFSDEEDGQEESRERERRERKLLEAMLSVKKRYGKNAMLKGTNLQAGATARERNNQIGGHRA